MFELVRKILEGQSTVAQFIDIADAVGMPVKVLRHVKKGYSLKPWADTNGARVILNRLDLTEETVSGLRRSSNHPISPTSVSSLYHESTHAFLDLTDYDESNEFKKAMSVYYGAKLQDGKTVSDAERVAQEAAGEYVGHRAKSAWEVRYKMALLEGILDDVDSGKSTATKAAIDIDSIGPFSLAYNEEMQRQVFGYQEVSGTDVHLASEPIPQELKDYCDKVILEGKIKNDFALMKQFHLQYDKLLRRLLCFRNSPATAGSPVMNFCTFQPLRRTSR